MEATCLQILQSLRSTQGGAEILQELLTNEALRLESLLMHTQQSVPEARWELGAGATLAPWNWNSPLPSEQPVSDEQLRLQMALVSLLDSQTPTSVPSSLGTKAVTPLRPGGEDEGILDVRVSNDRRLLVRVTLFASGFVIGPKGKSIRKIEILSRCRISSSVLETDSGRKIRLFCINGEGSASETAFEIVASAVALYKSLCDSTQQGKKVEHVQYVDGVKFYYYPPPKTATRELTQSKSC